jgi:hypothetical protein
MWTEARTDNRVATIIVCHSKRSASERQVSFRKIPGLTASDASGVKLY